VDPNAENLPDIPQSAYNSTPRPHSLNSETDLYMIRCNRCFKVQGSQEFVNNKARRSRVPLGEVQNHGNGTELLRECRSCREKRKRTRHTGNEQRAQKTSEANEGRLSSYPRTSWEDARRMINESYFPCNMKLKARSLEHGKEWLITDLHRHLPDSFETENHKSLAQFVVDQICEAEGFQFRLKSEYTLNKRARGRPTVFADAKVFVFACSQRLRQFKISTVPYGRTRNRRARVELYDCNGSISIIIPASTSNPGFDFSVQVNHDVHEGREYLGMPLVVQRWILQNPRPTSHLQREDLLRAIDRGELPSVRGMYLRPMLIHYWWKKATKDKIYRSKDSWLNIRDMLEEDPMVRVSSLFDY
jgi:hypothetical protein